MTRLLPEAVREVVSHCWLQFHRKQWACPFCKDTTPQTRSELEAHLAKIHNEKLKDGGFDVESCKFARIDATCCLLCTWWAKELQRANQSAKCDVSLDQFQQHLGFHMERLALSALPDYEADEDAISEDDEESEGEEASEGQRAGELMLKLKQERHSDFRSILYKIYILGERYRMDGRLFEAEMVFREAVEILGGEAVMEKIPDILRALSTVLFEQGKTEAALKTQRQIVHTMEKVLGLSSPETLNAVERLSEYLMAENEFVESWNLLEATLRIRNDALGPEHPDTRKVLEIFNKLNVMMKGTADTEDNTPEDTGESSTQALEPLPSTGNAEGEPGASRPHIAAPPREARRQFSFQNLFFQKQQKEQASHHAEAARKKEQPKGPVENRTESHGHAEGEEGDGALPKSAEWNSACWDSIPASGLNTDIVNEYLRSVFGSYNFYTKEERGILLKRGKSTETIVVPSKAAPWIIGKAGSTIQSLQKSTGCIIQISKAEVPGKEERQIELEGSWDAIDEAKREIMSIVAAAAQNENVQARLSNIRDRMQHENWRALR
ncbi:hypothetical protein N431DRAFT_448837 [Stipitochalara longipes BDJ]|nr:hypothetical protein N431DRAFT_448837 [Stipitochalara longipes BDJ]